MCESKLVLKGWASLSLTELPQQYNINRHVLPYQQTRTSISTDTYFHINRHVLPDAGTSLREAKTLPTKIHLQTCEFDLTQNLNECEKKSKYKEKNLNLTTKIALIYRSLPNSKPKKKSEF